MTQALLLFGETHAGFIAFFVSLFFGFHTWLMLKAMTTIEFCEKTTQTSGYDSSAYNRGFKGNVKAVLGDNITLWFLPLSPPSGQGLNFSDDQEAVPLVQGVERGPNSNKRDLPSYETLKMHGSNSPTKGSADSLIAPANFNAQMDSERSDSIA